MFTISYLCICGGSRDMGNKYNTGCSSKALGIVMLACGNRLANAQSQIDVTVNTA